MNEGLARKLQQVGLNFRLPGPFFSYEEISTGNVNHTYRVDYIHDDGTGMARIKSYLMQRVNTYAFRDPVALMENIDKVTQHIRSSRPGQTCLHFHHTEDGKTYIFDGDEFWRVCNYVPSVTYNNCDDLDVVRSAGEAFGDFQLTLQDFDASSLFYTIPDFHNTRKRYARLENDIAEDKLGRAANVRDEIEYLLSVKDLACKLTDMQENGELPLRVTHNDTKINNVLFDMNKKSLVVIDLDTVMPGLVGHDFGDAVRFAANFTDEDSEDTGRTGLDLNIFWAFADGFLSKTTPVLTENEISTLALSGFVLACELATRFLDDYITGDKYFKVKKPNHNVIRARCQVALAKDIYKKLEAMDAIVRGCAAKYSK